MQLKTSKMLDIEMVLYVNVLCTKQGDQIHLHMTTLQTKTEMIR